MDTASLFKLALPLIAFIVSYALQQDNFSKPMNAAIAATTIVLVSLVEVFVQGKLTGNPSVDLALITTAAIALQAEAFAPLQQYLRSNFPTKIIKQPK